MKKNIFCEKISGELKKCIILKINGSWYKKINSDAKKLKSHAEKWLVSKKNPW